MVLDTPIKGKSVSLSSVTEDDSEFILRLRTDTIIGKYLNPTMNDVGTQKLWIRNQRKSSNDYYFLISDRNSRPLGTISLYNIHKRQGEFGRWICPGNSIQALESVLLIHDFGFTVLGLDSIISQTNTLNRSAINFNKSFGATYTGEIATQVLSGIVVEKAIISSNDFPLIRKKILTLIEQLL